MNYDPATGQPLDDQDAGNPLAQPPWIPPSPDNAMPVAGSSSTPRDEVQWTPPQSTHPQLPSEDYASYGKRVIALIVDNLIALAILVVVVLLFLFAIGGIDAVDSNSGALTVGSVIAFVVFFFVAIIAITILPSALLSRKGVHNGQTWGKQLVGIRVIYTGRYGDTRMGWSESLQRELLWRGLIIGLIGGTVFIVPLIDLLWPLWDEHKRALHDIPIKTRVIEVGTPSDILLV